MGKYSNLKFFDSNSDELNLVYDEVNEVWGGMIYLPEVSTGLYETLTIYMFEEAVGSLGETKYIKPITQNSTYGLDIKLDFVDEYDTSKDIFMYKTNVEDGELYVEHEKTQNTEFSPANNTVAINPNGIKTVNSSLENTPIQINIALKSDEEGYHNRTLNIYEMTNGVISHEIANIKIYGETVGEDERLQDLLTNMGMSLKPTDYIIFEDSDIKEGGIDWKLINRKRRELLLQASEIKPFIGTYKAILNAIKYFGYENLTLKEYWLNINEQSENFGKLKAVAVPNQDIKGFLSAKNSDIEIPSSNLKKTSRFSLVYRLNNFNGEFDKWDIPQVEEATDFTPDEVLIKLYGLKKKLQKDYLPLQSRIVDIVGEGDYFSQFNINTWNNQQNIQTQNAGLDLVYNIFPNDKDIYIEDLRKVDRRFTGKGQDLEALANTDFSYGIEGYWKMGEGDTFPKLTDFTGNGNNGVMKNMTANDIVTTTSSQNISTKCAAFDGINDAVGVVTGDGLNPTKALTINTWVNYNDWSQGSASEHRKIISCHDNGGFGLQWNNKRIIGSARIAGAGGQLVMSGYNKMSNDTGSGFYATADDWHMISMTFDGRYLKLYIDGQQQDDGGAPQDQTIAYNVGQLAHTKDFFSLNGDNNTIEYSPNHPHDIFIGAEPTYNTATTLTTLSEFWYGLIDDTAIWSRALSATEISDLYNDMTEIKTNLNNSIEVSVKNFYNKYDSIDMSTYNDSDAGPIGAPMILDASESLPQSWDDASFSYDEAAISYTTETSSSNNLMTWDNWWTRNIYEVEWRLMGPNGYDRSFRGPIENFLEFPLVLPYHGKYSVEMALYDLYNVRSVLFKKDEIEVKQKNVEFYGLYQSLNDEPIWDDGTYAWKTAGAIWDLAGENTTSVDDFLATYYLTLDRANYINGDQDGWEFSTVERYGGVNEINYTSGPYAWGNLSKLNWNDGVDTSWDMTKIDFDENASFDIRFNGNASVSTSNILSISRYINGILTNESYTVTSTLPATAFDMNAYQNIADELNGLDEATYPILSSFNYNPLHFDINYDGINDITSRIVAVAKLPLSSYDIESVNFTGSLPTRLRADIVNNHKANNPKYNTAKVIKSHSTIHKFNHMTFSFDNSKAPGIVEHEWTIKNNTANVDDIYYSNKWLTYAFTEKGNYTISLETKDVNGNINKATKNILTII